ncbi:MAG: glycosyltransferase family 4 protein [Crocinitomicaceae bacterium]|nr:glycosyltransferase family 4 protein [Crocinitomicaceae bacterium]
MKILMLLDEEFPPDPRVEHEIHALTSAGHSIVLLCPTREGKELREQWNGIQIYRKVISAFKYKSKVGALKAPVYYNFWKGFFKEYRSEIGLFDVVHAHDLIMAPVAFWIQRKFGGKTVLDLHENYPYLIRDAKHTQSKLGKFLSDHKKWIQFEKTAVVKADKVLTVVKEMRQRVVNIGKKTDEVFVYQNVPNLSELSFLNPTEAKSDNFTLVYAGGLTPARGLSTVLQAISLLANEGDLKFKLVVCGTGSAEASLKEEASALGIQDHIDFLGWVNQKDVFTIIGKGHATIIPHYRSVQNDCSSPNKLFQYMFMGKPVISSNCTSLKRLIVEENCGLIYQHDSPEDLRAVLKKLMTDEVLTKMMGDNGHKSVIKKYNVDVEKSELIEMYSNFSL